jgi:3-hydroxyacyl-CoA dehydrogenase
MFYADTVGLPKVLARIQELEKAHGKVWKPSALLVKLAESGGSFGSV